MKIKEVFNLSLNNFAYFKALLKISKVSIETFSIILCSKRQFFNI